MYLDKPSAAGDNLKVTEDQRESKNRYAENANWTESQFKGNANYYNVWQFKLKDKK